MSVSIRPVRVQALREAILVCLAEPRSIAEIARRIGCSARAARRHVAGLSELGSWSLPTGQGSRRVVRCACPGFVLPASIWLRRAFSPGRRRRGPLRFGMRFCDF